MTFWDVLPESFDVDKFEVILKDLAGSNYDYACNFASWIIYKIAENEDFYKTVVDIINAHCLYESNTCLIHECSEEGTLIKGRLPSKSKLTLEGGGENLI